MKKYIILLFCMFMFGCQEKEEIELSLTFEDIPTVEYGENFDTKTLVKECEGTINSYPTLETKKIGKQTLIFEVVNSDKKKNFEYVIEVIDTKKPDIQLKKEEIEINCNGKFDALSYVHSIQDGVDGKLQYKQEKDIKKNERGYYTYQDLVKLNKPGSYEVIYTAIDRSGNEEKKVLKVIVKEEKKVAEKKPVQKENTKTETPTPEIPKKEEPSLPNQNQYNYVLKSTVDNMNVAKTNNQIVAVTSTSSTSRSGILQYFVKNGDEWVEKLKVKCYLGKAGMGTGKEGSTKTPVGSYTFTHAYGIKGNPGSVMPYTQINKNHYWCGDQYYNQFVDEGILDHSQCSIDNDEHLIDYPVSYDYFAAFNYNASHTPGKGAAFFLHCNDPKYNYTEGCISIPKNDMIYLLKNIKTSTRLVISQIKDITNY